MDIKNIENMLMRTWPALKQEVYDGWILRYSMGYTREGNSVSPFYESFFDHQEKFAYCEHYFESRGLKVNYRLIEEDNCLIIDKELGERGYVKESLMSVQEAELSSIKFNVDGLIIENQFSEYWFEFFSKEMNLTENESEVLRRILKKNDDNNFYVLKKEDNKLVAGGLGVIEGNKLDIYNIYVSHEARGNGHGEEVVKRIMLEGRWRNVDFAYLQVAVDNIKALNLYKKLGFKEIYKYWYRVKK
jgi:ribosomal protein S18 acetylase RimI-like enzyme